MAPSGAWPACPGFLDTSGPFAQRLRARRAPEWVLWPHACACPAAGAILSAVWRGSRGGPIARARSASYRPRFRRAQLVSGLGSSSRASVGIALRVLASLQLWVCPAVLAVLWPSRPRCAAWGLSSVTAAFSSGGSRRVLARARVLGRACVRCDCDSGGAAACQELLHEGGGEGSIGLGHLAARRPDMAAWREDRGRGECSRTLSGYRRGSHIHTLILAGALAGSGREGWDARVGLGGGGRGDIRAPQECADEVRRFCITHDHEACAGLMAAADMSSEGSCAWAHGASRGIQQLLQFLPWPGMCVVPRLAPHTSRLEAAGASM